MADNENTVPISEKSMRVYEFLNASDDAIRERTVDCPTCPVNMLCQSGEGSTKHACPTCGMTAVMIDTDDMKTCEHLYVIDCGKHGFPKDVKACNWCDGRIMEHEQRDPAIAPQVHWLYTVHAKVSIVERKKKLRETEPICKQKLAKQGKK